MSEGLDLDVSGVPSRLEMIQAKRFAMLEKIEQVDGFEQDVEIGNMYLTGLRDLEKQELYKHKSAQDKSEGDANRDIARKALEISNELRRQRRDGNPTHEYDNNASVPKADESKLSGRGDDRAAGSSFEQIGEWSDFQKEMIAKGLDPRYKIDPDTGDVVPIED